MELCEMGGIESFVPENAINGEIFGRLKVFGSVSGERAGDAREGGPIRCREGRHVRKPPVQMGKRLEQWRSGSGRDEEMEV